MKEWKLTIGIQNQSPVINLFYQGKRFRYWNGKTIDVNLCSKTNPELLKSAFELRLLDGWKPKIKEKIVKKDPIRVLCVIGQGIDLKRSQGCSNRFIKDAQRILVLWDRFENEVLKRKLLIEDLKAEHIKNFLVRPNWSPKTQRTVKSTLSPLLSHMKPDLVNKVKLHKPVSKLHKPITELAKIFNELEQFNKDLYICCLITYGCLLRPHREVRELTWGDFTEDLSFIKLSGNRNKSGRNRIVPVPYYVKELLKKGEPNHNIFSGTTKPLNADYFKTVWGRFKKVSLLLEQDQTLYSFRHSGAINIFKRTGSLSKLQKAMGHSNMMVSMTYLRGLEISELEEEDMPVI